MFFAQYYLDRLSQASCLIGDRTTGRAVVVDHVSDLLGGYQAWQRAHVEAVPSRSER